MFADLVLLNGQVLYEQTGCSARLKKVAITYKVINFATIPNILLSHSTAEMTDE
jgi:hypothetical protein